MKIFQVDAFTEKPFRGNPAAVCILPSNPSVEWMQDVASEMTLAETAFLVSMNDGYNLRWFTPNSEVDLCGHATLASAHTGKRICTKIGKPSSIPKRLTYCHV